MRSFITRPGILKQALSCHAILIGAGILSSAFAADKPSNDKLEPIAIAEIKRTTPVDFEKEILPIFKNNCLACHNQTKAKADLVLETPQTILKGGESGPAVVAGRSDESLLLKAASHRIDPQMPPRNNKVAASDLTPEELGLIKLWINEGAKGEVRGNLAIEWKTLPEGLNPILAVALSPDGQFAACGRGNQIFIYHVPSGQLVTRLTDPSLLKTGLYHEPGVAHRDLVMSLAFNPDGSLLASGDFRQAKIWRRPKNVVKETLQFAGHSSIQEVAVSADGKWLAVSGDDAKISLWDLKARKEVKQLTGPDKGVTSLKFSPDNNRLAAGAADKKIRIWNIPDGELIAEKETPAAINALTWLAGGMRLVSGDTDKLVRIWKLSDGAKPEIASEKELKGHSGPVTALQTIWPAGKQIISGSEDGTVRHWDSENGKLLHEMKHGGAVIAVAARADGKRFASAGTNNMAKLWDVENGKEIAQLKGDRYAQNLVAVKERSLTLANSEIAYWKGAEENAAKQHKTELDRIKKSTDTIATAEKALAEKQKAATEATTAKTAAEKEVTDLNAQLAKTKESFESANKALQVAKQEAKTALEKSALATQSVDQAKKIREEIEALAADAAAVASKTKSTGASESKTPAENAKSSSDKGEADAMATEAAAVAAKAKAFAESLGATVAAKSKAADEARALAEKAIDQVVAKAMAAGEAKATSERLTAEITAKQKSANDKLTASKKTADDTDKQLKTAQTAKGNADSELLAAISAAQKAADTLSESQTSHQFAQAELKKVDAELQLAKTNSVALEKTIRDLAFSPDNKLLATAGDDAAVHTWSAENGTAFETFKGPRTPMLALAFVDGGVLSSSSETNAVLWDLNPDWKLERLIGTGEANSLIVDRVNALRFSPDGERLATGSGEPTRGGEIKLWKVADGELLQDFKNIHSDAVFSLDFSLDGKRLASGAADKFVKVIDLSSARLVKSFEGHTHHVLGVSWKADGRTLASAGADGVVKIWDFVTGERKKNIDGFNKEVTAINFIGITDEMVVCSGDAQVRQLKDNGNKGRSYEGVGDFMHSVAATPDGKIIAAGGQDSVLRVWNGTDGKVLATFAPPATSTKLADAGQK